MKTHVTVVPSDFLILVEGEGLRFTFPAPSNLHALQWHGGAGHMEFTDDRNHPLTPEDYAGDVAPFVTLWEEEKARREAKIREEESRPVPLAEALEKARSALAGRRRKAEYGGVRVRGIVFSTEQKDELRLYALERVFTADPAHLEVWKAGDVWVNMDAALFAEYAAAFQAHIPACFAVEKQKQEALGAAAPQDAAAVVAWLEINLETGWPGEVENGHD